MKVVSAERISPKALERMAQEGAEILDRAGLDRPSLVASLPGVQALLVRSQTQVDKELLDAGQDLGLVGRAGTGVDNIDLEYAQARGVHVVNAPGANAVSVAEHAFGMILAVSRRLVEGTVGLRSGLWEKKSLKGTEMQGKTLGIVGFGRIGRELAIRGKAFGMSVAAYDPYLSETAGEAYDVKLVSFETLCSQSDFISLHLPINSETRHLIDEKAMERMKEEAVLINCARGGLIDEEALEKALFEGKIRGAGMDVFADEPQPRASLLSLPRVVATPHVAASTPEAEEKAGLMIADQVIAFMHGRPLEHQVV